MRIFQKVHCKAYLKKISDGVHIAVFDQDGHNVLANRVTFDYRKAGEITAKAYTFDKKKNDFVEIANLSEFAGEGVEKVYRERVEEEFDGFIVGITHVDVKGIIGTDWYEDDHTSVGFCFKRITENPKVAVVYFKNNCKRYVLMEDLEESEERIDKR